MKRTLALVLALSTVTLSAVAQEAAGSGLKPFVGIGYSWGGDTIQAVTLIPQGQTAKRYEEDISAGAGLMVQAGVAYSLRELPLTLKGSVGYHNDQVNGVNGESSAFRRTPIELLLQWHTSKQGRIGFGLRHITRATFASKGGTCGPTNAPVACATYREPMKASTGLVLEGEWMLTPSWGVQARYVFESYRFKDSSFDATRYEGNHLGLMTSYYFN